MTIAERIKYRREELGMTQAELAKRLGFKSRSSINKIELGLQDLRLDSVSLIAKALDTTPAFIMGWDENTVVASNLTPFRRPNRQIPLVGSIACGTPILAEQNIQRLMDLPDGMDADFCLTCKGDSMTGARIYDGDIVYIRQQSEVDNGQIAAVVIGDEATLKRVYYYPDKNKLVLNAENPKYEPFVYSGDELNEIRIAGLAIAFTSVVR